MPALCFMAPEKGKATLGKNVAHYLNPDNFGKTTWRLWFIDPINLRKAPTGDDGRGYKLKMQKGWLVKYGPALRASLSVLRAALAVGRLVGVHADEVVMGAASGLGLKNSGAPNIPQEELDDLQEALGLSSVDLEAECDGDVPNGTQIRQLEGSHYRLVKQIVEEFVDPPDRAFQRTGLLKTIGRDRHVEWVLEGDVSKFKKKAPVAYMKPSSACAAFILQSLAAMAMAAVAL